MKPITIKIKYLIGTLVINGDLEKTTVDIEQKISEAVIKIVKSINALEKKEYGSRAIERKD